MELAPVILFAFNRPEHTRKTLTALKRNHLSGQSKLFIYIDGPKSQEQAEKVEEVKKVAAEESWCGEVKIVESKTNKGLYASVIAGVTEIVNRYGKVIVLEDDLITDSFFLKFMNDALEKYEKDAKVISMTAYIYPVKGLAPLFFLKGADCWGWATWKRGWDLLETDGKKLLKQLEEKKLTAEFDFNNSYPYSQMLRDRIEGKNNSWAILWYASAFLANKLTLYPGSSLVQNIGIDGSGMHSGTYTDKFDVELKNEEIILKDIPVEEDKASKARITGYFFDVFGTRPKSIGEKITFKLKAIFKGN